MPVRAPEHDRRSLLLPRLPVRADDATSRVGALSGYGGENRRPGLGAYPTGFIARQHRGEMDRVFEEARVSAEAYPLDPVEYDGSSAAFRPMSRRVRMPAPKDERPLVKDDECSLQFELIFTDGEPPARRRQSCSYACVFNRSMEACHCRCLLPNSNAIRSLRSIQSFIYSLNALFHMGSETGVSLLRVIRFNEVVSQLFLTSRSSPPSSWVFPLCMYRRRVQPRLQLPQPSSKRRELLLLPEAVCPPTATYRLKQFPSGERCFISNPILLFFFNSTFSLMMPPSPPPPPPPPPPSPPGTASMWWRK